MGIIALSEIKINARQRQEFKEEAIKELANSIHARGLLHPVVLQNVDGEFHLVAGERRYRAVQYLHSCRLLFSHDDAVVQEGDIPYTLVGDMDAVQVKETELEENIMREDLTWQERQLALAELHTLRTGQNPEQTVSDTARELEERIDIPFSSAHGEITRANLVAEHLDDPDVKKAKNARDAYNIVNRKLQEQFAKQMARPPRNEAYTLIEGTLLTRMALLPREEFTTIIADPPYGMGADTFGDAAKLEHKYDDSPEYALECAKVIFRQGLVVTKPQAHLFMFCDIDNFMILREFGMSEGWDVWRTPVVWQKGSMGHAPRPQHGPKRTYELILFAIKGNKNIAAPYSDLTTALPEKEKYHAAQKPVQLYKNLLMWGTKPGDHILDPCCGRGTIFLAAKDGGMKATGIELNPDAISMCELLMRDL